MCLHDPLDLSDQIPEHFALDSEPGEELIRAARDAVFGDGNLLTSMEAEWQFLADQFDVGLPQYERIDKGKVSDEELAAIRSSFGWDRARALIELHSRLGTFQRACQRKLEEARIDVMHRRARVLQNELNLLKREQVEAEEVLRQRNQREGTSFVTSVRLQKVHVKMQSIVKELGMLLTRYHHASDALKAKHKNVSMQDLPVWCRNVFEHDANDEQSGATVNADQPEWYPEWLRKIRAGQDASPPATARALAALAKFWTRKYGKVEQTVSTWVQPPAYHDGRLAVDDDGEAVQDEAYLRCVLKLIANAPCWAAEMEANPGLTWLVCLLCGLSSIVRRSIYKEKDQVDPYNASSKAKADAAKSEGDSTPQTSVTKRQPRGTPCFDPEFELQDHRHQDHEKLIDENDAELSWLIKAKLTDQECQVLRLRDRDFKQSGIAEELQLPTKHVGQLLRHAMNKLRLANAERLFDEKQLTEDERVVMRDVFQEQETSRPKELGKRLLKKLAKRLKKDVVEIEATFASARRKLMKVDPSPAKEAATVGDLDS